MASSLFMFIALGCVVTTTAAVASHGSERKSNCSEDANCARCLQPSGICQYCNAGYIRAHKGDLCQQSNHIGNCDRHCIGSCESNGKCNSGSTCAVGFVRAHDLSCRSCDMNCDLDTGCAKSGVGLCDTKCIHNYVLVNNTCKACSDNCDSGCSKSGPARCDSQCSKGYALDNSSGVCMPCGEHCAAGCTKAGPHFCDGHCKPGYTLLSPTVPVCAECDSNCQGSCDSVGAFGCDRFCRQGYSLNDTTHRCFPCSSNCKSGCHDMGPGLCDSECNRGFYFNSTVHACYPCDSKCAGSCRVSGASKCDGPCQRGYRLVDSLCVGY